MASIYGALAVMQSVPLLWGDVGRAKSKMSYHHQSLPSLHPTASCSPPRNAVETARAALQVLERISDESLIQGIIECMLLVTEAEQADRVIYSVVSTRKIATAPGRKRHRTQRQFTKKQTHS